MLLKASEQKLLEALSWHVWKTGLQLVSDGAGSRGVIYVHLANLQRLGLVVSRLRSEEQFPSREYKLTESGLRHRSESAEVTTSARVVFSEG